MTSPPDKLFRDGLEHHRKAAPASAWERIESGLDRKKQNSPWFKIAATLLLLMVASFVIWQLNETDTAVALNPSESTSGKLTTDSISSIATEESKDKIRESSVVSREAVVNHQTSDVRRETSDMRRETLSMQNTPATNSKQVSDENKNPTSSHLQPTVYSLPSSTSTEDTFTPEESRMTATTEPDRTSIETTAVSQAEITHITSVTERASDAKRTNITYTAEEVNAKYLKKESIPQATPEKKNASGLQKVVDLALDFKNEGSVLGELREKKNELLSFNIPSNKRETNK